MIPDKIYIPHNKTRYPQGLCVHWNRNKNKGNYDSGDDIEYIRADKLESAWEYKDLLFKLYENKNEPDKLYLIFDRYKEIFKKCNKNNEGN